MFPSLSSRRRIRAFVALAMLSAGSVLAKIPVTDRPMNSAPGTFRFAIFSDRTGEMRPGIFEDAVAKVNLLQPDFAMSVGDLINGYTTNPKTWDAEWREFEQIVEQLQMPFYYVPGNHDVTNAKLRAVWQQRRGDLYFSFVHEQVLFLCLDSDEISAGDDGGMGPEQIAWARKTLDEHQDVRWTLVFFHRPLWMHKNARGYEKIEAALQGRNYTVFTAHWHHYLNRTRKGMQHYVLATTGGGSNMRGKSVGEFDHVTWVTMKPDGPVVVNLELSGIVPADIVSAANEEFVETLRAGRWLSVAAHAQSSPDLAAAPIPIQLSNPGTQPLRVTALLHGTDWVRFEPAALDVVVPPHGSLTVPVQLVAIGDPVPIDELNDTEPAVTLNAAYALKSGPVTLSATRRVLLDRDHPVARAAATPVLDGDLSEWPDNAFIVVTHPQKVEAATRWEGPADGHFRFAVQQAQDRLYVAVETFDDRVVVRDDEAVTQDAVVLQTTIAGVTRTLQGIAGLDTTEGRVRKTPTGLRGEFSIPLAAGQDRVRLNVAFKDRDRGLKSSVLWWRDPDAAELGQFVLPRPSPLSP